MYSPHCQIDGCLSCILLPRLSAALSVRALFLNQLSPQNKHFQGIHSCLSPVEIPDLTSPPLLLSLIPIISIPQCLRISSSKNPLLPLEFHKAIRGMVHTCMDIFWNSPILQTLLSNENYTIENLKVFLTFPNANYNINT